MNVWLFSQKENFGRWLWLPNGECELHFFPRLPGRVALRETWLTPYSDLPAQKPVPPKNAEKIRYFTTLSFDFLAWKLKNHWEPRGSEVFCRISSIPRAAKSTRPWPAQHPICTHSVSRRNSIPFTQKCSPTIYFNYSTILTFRWTGTVPWEACRRIIYLDMYTYIPSHMKELVG